MKNSFKKEEILRFMSSNDVALEAGFKLISEKGRTLDFYDEFKLKGFLNPEEKYEQHIDSGTIKAPFWPALIYLEALAKKVSEDGADRDIALDVSKILSQSLSSKHENYRSAFKLIEIASMLPTYAIEKSLVENIGKRLISDVDNSLSLSVFINKFFPKIMQRDDLSESILNCVKCIYVPNKNFNPSLSYERQYFKADSYWHNLFSQKYSQDIAKIIGDKFVLELSPMLDYLFPSKPSDIPSWLVRPAIEEHGQNREWYSSQNILVVTIRDGLLGLCDKSPEESKVIVTNFYKGSKIQRRIAIHILSEKYSEDREFLELIIDKNLFDDECIHESYNFLRKHYVNFNKSFQDEICRILLEIYDVNSDDKKVLKKLYRWLSSIEASGNSLVADSLDNIRSRIEASLPSNPDFYSYVETAIGPGPSPFTSQEILYFLEGGYLTQKFNQFQGSKDIFSENREALCSEFEAVIKANPMLVIAKLPLLFDLERPYQYSLVNSFANLYARSDIGNDLKNGEIIYSLIAWIKDVSKTLKEADFDGQGGNEWPNAVWLVSAIADFIKTISRSDDNNLSKISEENLIEVLRHLLNIAPDEVNSSTKEPMNFVINSTKGRLIEVFILLTLGVCRRRSKVADSHSQEWRDYESIYDSELIGSPGKSNHKFLCLSGRYLLQLNFMSSQWVNRNLSKLLNPVDSEAFFYAMDGLAYAPSSSSIFNWLKQEKVFERGLLELNANSIARKKLLERLILSYTWGEEELNSKLMIGVMDSDGHADLENALKFLWSISNQELEERQIERITILWNKVYDYVMNKQFLLPRVGDLLLRLITYFNHFDAEVSSKFIALIPLSSRSDLSYSLIDSLLRLFPSNPENIGKFSATYLERHPNLYDYERKWLKLAELLHENPKCRIFATTVISKMDSNPGFRELYRKSVG